MASINPFEIKKEKTEDDFAPLGELWYRPYTADGSNPCSALRVLLACCTESASVFLKHDLVARCAAADLKREIALLARAEQFQQEGLSLFCREKPAALFYALFYEQLNEELTAAVAQKETDEYVKAAFDFALAEDCDHLYRFSCLIKAESDADAKEITGGITEIMPGRPSISQHRYPFDDVRRFVPFALSGVKTWIHLFAVAAVKRRTLDFYTNAGYLCRSETARRLFAEIALTEEQHLMQYNSLSDPSLSVTEKLVLCEYAECYLYYSAYAEETDEKIKQLWEKRFLREAAHLQKAAQLLKTFENKDYKALIPQENFPDPLSLNDFAEKNKPYIRKVLKETIDLTAVLEDYAKADEIPQNYAFFKYNGKVTRPTEKVASHSVAEKLIERDGKDYRFEESPHPVPEMRDRTRDNTRAGR